MRTDEKRATWFLQSILNSYSQVFFSDNKTFATVLVIITFIDFYTGLFGLASVLVTTAMARWIGFDLYKVKQGYYGFNSLLVGLGMGIFFQPGILLLMMVVIAAIFTLFISVSFEGVIGKYALPYLSLPFVISLWFIMLASREFQALGLNERGIYTLNELYLLGGHTLVKIYEWWGHIPFPPSVRAYFLSLGAIFFQFNVFSGVLVAIGLLVYSRIAFTLSLLGFYTAFLFYMLIGASFSEVSYSYIGFNYILSAIAIGGYFIIPNRSSFLWVILLIPMVAIVTISLGSILIVYQLPIYSLPFNIMALLFLYVLKFRQHNRIRLNTLFVQQNAPEKNLYAFQNHMKRFGKESPIPLHLPFMGEWTVTQGHNGEYTHKSDWRHAWDFEMKDEKGNTYKNSGDFPEDYYCYDKTVTAPADGVIETIIDGVEDNIIGQKNLEFNWGNTIVIKHGEHLYSKMSHLRDGSIEVQEGQKVKLGDSLAKCGNSGLSPYPHLHFQVQSTPYIGSRTIDYPISNYMLNNNGIFQLQTVAIPEKEQTISNIQTHQAIKKAFHFIPGERIQLQVAVSKNKEREAAEEKPGGYEELLPGQTTETTWEIKRDLALNTFIECETSGCRAWFKTDGKVLYFTHFEGKRNNPLYHFYLGAFKICMGHYSEMQLSDIYPTNIVFRKSELFLHDFIAPFISLKKAFYKNSYIIQKESFSDIDLKIATKTTKEVFGKITTFAETDFTIDKNGLKGFVVRHNHQIMHVACTGKNN